MSNKINNELKINSHPSFFDPRVLDDDVDNRRVWNSNSVNLAIQGLYDGYELIESPFNKKIKDAQLRKANLPFKYTDDELKILSLCMNDKQRDRKSVV